MSYTTQIKNEISNIPKETISDAMESNGKKENVIKFDQ